jgi:hypothetical protein
VHKQKHNDGCVHPPRVQAKRIRVEGEGMWVEGGWVRVEYHYVVASPPATPVLTIPTCMYSVTPPLPKLVVASTQ